MKNNFLISLVTLISFNSIAGDLVVGAEIVEVTNTSSNRAAFSVMVSGGSGVCKDKHITFPASAAVTPEVYQRAYSSALTALTTGFKVRIHNYQDDSCNAASYIRLSK